jgi:hypothetical protein
MDRACSQLPAFERRSDALAGEWISRSSRVPRKEKAATAAAADVETNADWRAARLVEPLDFAEASLRADAELIEECAEGNLQARGVHVAASPIAPDTYIGEVFV